MKQHEGRHIRRLIVAVTLVAMLVTGGLLLTGSAQRTLAVAPLALENSVKTASSETVSPGGELTYSIVLNNDSEDSVTSVSVTDALPDTVTYVEGSQGISPAGAALFNFDEVSQTASFSVSSIAGGASVTLSFRVTAAASLQPGDVITNTALVEWADSILEPSVAVTVEAPPTARIDVPWENQLITQRGTFTVEGRVWADSQTPEFPEAPVLNEIFSTQSFYNVTWSAVGGADVYILQEADNPHFTDATEFAPTATPSQLVTGKTAGTYYYRVKASSAVYGDGFWSNVVSHTVSTALWAEAEAAVAPASVSNAPSLEINIKPVGGVDEWISVDSVTESGVGDWWNWSYDWTLPEADGVEYVVQVRGIDSSGGFDLDAVDEVTVTIQNEMTTIYLPLIMRRYPPVPLAPALQIVGDPATRSYQLSWTYPHTEFVPTSYELQESTNAQFTDPTVLPAPVTSPYARTDMPGGHYYYRVRGLNAAGVGDWSNVVHVEVPALGFFDDFTNPASGWPREVVRIDNRAVFDMDYDSGTYRAKIMLDTTGLNNYYMGIARAPYENPFAHYEVEVEHRFVRAADQGSVDPEWGKGGLVFAASPDYRTLFVVEWRWPDGWCAISKYTGVGSTVVDWRWIPGNGSVRAWGPCHSVKSGYDNINEARAVVNGNTASVYINDQLISTFSDSALTGAHRLGVISGSYERTPVESRFDNFRITSR